MKSNYLSDLRTRRSFIRQAACAAVGTVAMSNCLRDLRLINSAVAQGSFSDYKALVCVFLNGGNDANNMFIPTIPSEWNSYSTIRTPVLAIPNTDGTGATALPLKFNNTTYQDVDGHTYGFHPAMPELVSLFNTGQVAGLLNVGSLCYPITKAQYNSHSVPVPPQLFSHSDQQVQWQTSIPDQPPSTGWGGRIADLYTSSGVNPSGSNIVSMAITLAGSNTFQVGTNATDAQFSVTTGGAVTLSSGPSATMKTILGGTNGLQNEAALPNLQTAAYAQTLYDAVDIANTLSTDLSTQATANPAWLSGYHSNTITVPNAGGSFSSGLMAQLKMVARLIDISKNTMGMKRQIFFVQVGGYDNHTLQTKNAGSTTTNNANVIIGAHANLLAELSQSLNAFYTAMVGQGLQNNVTAFTVSDFARTFPSNGSGSDHGWGSHHLVVGGAVNGGKTYGHLPALTVGGPNDTSTGRWIPTTSVDQYAATLASWFGVTSSNLSTIFPNVNRFASSNLGFI